MILWIFCGFLIGYLTRIPPVVLSGGTIALWQAVVTTAAVAVALFATIRPAWKEARRNEKVANNLRLLIEQNMVPLHFFLKKQLEKEHRPNSSIATDPTCRKYFGAIESLMSKIDILKESEILSLTDLYFDATLYFESDSNSRNFVFSLVSNIAVCLKLFSKRKSLMLWSKDWIKELGKEATETEADSSSK